MTTLTFDTLAFVKRLKAAGISEPQAEAMSDAFKEAQQASISELATKADIQQASAEIQQIKIELSSEIKLLRWMVGLMLAGVVSLVLKAFFMH